MHCARVTGNSDVIPPNMLAVTIALQARSGLELSRVAADAFTFCGATFEVI